MFVFSKISPEMATKESRDFMHEVIMARATSWTLDP